MRFSLGEIERIHDSQNCSSLGFVAFGQRFQPRFTVLKGLRTILVKRDDRTVFIFQNFGSIESIRNFTEQREGLSGTIVEQPAGTVGVTHHGPVRIGITGRAFPINGQTGLQIISMRDRRFVLHIFDLLSLLFQQLRPTFIRRDAVEVNPSRGHHVHAMLDYSCGLALFVTLQACIYRCGRLRSNYFHLFSSSTNHLT